MSATALSSAGALALARRGGAVDVGDFEPARAAASVAKPNQDLARLVELPVLDASSAGEYMEAGPVMALESRFTVVGDWVAVAPGDVAHSAAAAQDMLIQDGARVGAAYVGRVIDAGVRLLAQRVGDAETEGSVGDAYWRGLQAPIGTVRCAAPAVLGARFC